MSKWKTRYLVKEGVTEAYRVPDDYEPEDCDDEVFDSKREALVAALAWAKISVAECLADLESSKQALKREKNDLRDLRRQLKELGEVPQ